MIYFQNYEFPKLLDFPNFCAAINSVEWYL